MKKQPSAKKEEQRGVFEFFTEIGIINQLGGTRFQRLLPGGLYISHFSVLNHLVRLGDAKSPLSMANAFQVTKGAMTNTLTTLEKRQLVKIKPNPADGRSKLVFITAKGKKLREECIVRLETDFQVLGENIDLNILREALPTLRKVREVLDRLRDG